ncbi:MAG: DUF11 domain-containing protein [Ardenticatenaceae bacterium]|nr:DUF11 domain-containing protein [Anaerolineales bacterium]MCB8920638.1 DUF11 domain-containing protein [Ardenticatenaceae bacterium]
MKRPFPLFLALTIACIGLFGLLTLSEASALTPANTPSDTVTLKSLIKLAKFHAPASPLDAHIWVNVWSETDPAENSNFVYHIRLQNDGLTAANNVVLENSLPPELVLITYTAPYPHSSSGVPPADVVHTWDVGLIPANSFREFDVFVNVLASNGQPLSHNVSMTTTSPNTSLPGDYTRVWSGVAQPNDAQLSVSGDTWVYDPAPGSEYVYEFAVCNQGSTSSDDVFFELSLPSQATLVDWSAPLGGWAETGSDAHTLLLARPSVAGAGSCTAIWVWALLDGGVSPYTSLEATAVITSSSDNSPDDNTFIVYHQTDSLRTNVEIFKQWERGTLYPGGFSNYRITIKNQGNSPIQGVWITDTFSAQGSFREALRYAITGTVPFTPEIITASEVSWYVDRLESGQHLDFEITLDISPGAMAGEILSNTAVVTSLPGEILYTDNQHTALEPIHDIGNNLRVRKEGGWDFYSGGHLAYYQLYVDNIGDVPVAGFTVTDTYPVSWTVGSNFSPDWRVTNFAIHNDQHYFTATFGNQIDSGDTAVIYFDLELPYNLSVPEQITNTANVTFFPDDVEPLDNSVTHILTYTPMADLDVFKYGPPLAGVGEPISYTIDVSNYGPDDATHVHLTDSLPPGTTLLDFSPAAYCAYDAGNATLNCDAPSLAAGSSQTVWVTVQADAPGVITNTAEAIADEQDPFMENNGSLAETAVADLADLSLTKFADQTGVFVGDNITYFLDVTNYGPNPANNVRITDTLPMETAVLTITADSGAICNYDPIFHEVICDIPTIPPTPDTYGITITVQTTATGYLINNAIVTAQEMDPYLDNNFAMVNVTVGNPGDVNLWAYKYASICCNYGPGTTYTYTLDFGNDGPDSGLNTLLTDTLPPGLDFLGANIPPASTDPLVWDLGTLSPGIVNSILITVSINSQIDSGTPIENIVEINGSSNDLNPSDNVFTHIIEPGVDIGVDKQASSIALSIGSELTYTLQVYNSGYLTATNINFTDYLPDGFTLLNVDPFSNCSSGGLMVNCFIDSLAPGENFPIYLMGTVDQAGMLVNTAVVNASDAIDINPDNNHDAVTVLALETTDPSVYQVNPPSGSNADATPILIRGANFSPNARVFINSTELNNVTQFDFNTLGAIVPSGVPTGTYDVTVLNPNGASDTLFAAFTVFAPAPLTIDAVEPDYAANDGPVWIIITGSGFAPGMSGGLFPNDPGNPNQPLEFVFYLNDNTLLALVPYNIAPDVYDLGLMKIDGTSTSLPAAYHAFAPEELEDFFARPSGFFAHPIGGLTVGEPGVLGLRVLRPNGLITYTNAVAVDFYDGNPYEGGTLLGRQTVDSFAPRSKETVTITWTPETNGEYTIYAVIDPDNVITENNEMNNVVMRPVFVRPSTLPGAAPEVISFTINNGDLTDTDRQVLCNVTATSAIHAPTSDPAYIHYVDYIFNQSLNDWVPVKSSAWLPYADASTDFLWNLSATSYGAHYVQVWVADQYGRISEAPGEQFINILPEIGTYIAHGEAHIYRWYMQNGASLDLQIVSEEGDADLYVWDIDGNRVAYSDSEEPIDAVSFAATYDGLYGIEIVGNEASTYTLEIVANPVLKTDLRPLAPDDIRGHVKGRGRPYSFPGENPSDDLNVPDVPRGGIRVYLPVVIRP